MGLTDVSNTPISDNTGTEYYTQAVTGGTLHVFVTKTLTGEVLATAATFQPGSGSGAATPAVALTALDATTGSLPAGAITGAFNVTMKSTNATPGAQLVRTAAQMFADMPGAFVGMSWNLRIVGVGAGTLTLTADAGNTVTLTGTMTVPTNTFRDFVCTFNSPMTATIVATATGTYS